jgi:hypothetical protein
LPKASSTVTAGCVGNVVVARAPAAPEGCVENTSWLAAPGPDTEKGVLVALTTDDEDPAGAAVAKSTYEVGNAEPLFPTDVRICPEKVQDVGSVNSSKAVPASGGDAKVME